ncbi:MAG: VWA domain-containing protein [Dehalococcoidia bacterium]
MNDIRFADPILLALLAALPLLIVWERWRSRHAPSLRYSNVGYLAGASGLRTRLRWLPPALRLLAIALVAGALARPQRGEADALVTTEGIDIAMALDVSASMQQADFGESTRIDEAQRVAAEFVAARETDRVALVAFRRQSRVLSPLTVDYAAVSQLIEASERIRIEDGTGIGIAIAESVNVLRDSRAASRIVILLTDGENNEPAIPPLDAARIAEALHIRVYTIGILSAAGLTTVNGENLSAVADITGGRYYSARDPDSLADIYDEIAELEKSQIDDTRFTRFDELFWILLIPAFGLVALEILLRATLLRRLP